MSAEVLLPKGRGTGGFYDLPGVVMEQLVIRAICESDEPQWRRLWTLYLEFYESSVSEEVYSTTFGRLLSADDNEFHGLINSQIGSVRLFSSS